jgi:hypothetical protein
VFLAWRKFIASDALPLDHPRESGATHKDIFGFWGGLIKL